MKCFGSRPDCFVALRLAMARVRSNEAASRQGTYVRNSGTRFLLGMQHALEADHIAATSSIAARRTHTGDIVKHGLTLTFPYREFLQLNEGECLRVRLTGSLARGFNL